MNNQEEQARIPYLSCPQKAHEGQMLNLVCIGCKQAGLICSLCRQQHRNHRIIPLKILIHNLKNKLTQSPGDEQYCAKMQQLQNLKNSMLFELKCCVQTIAGQFQRLEQDIIDHYNEVKLQIIEQIQLGLEIDGLLHSVIAGTISKEVYMDNIQKVAKYVKQRGEKQFVLSMDFDKILGPLKENQRSLPKKLKAIEDHVLKVLKLNSSFQAQPKIEEPIAPIEKQTFQYRFSSTFKSSFITLNDKQTIATQSQTQSGRFVLIEEGMGIKNRKIKFKVKTLKNWVGIGVCLKNKIEGVNYFFKYEAMGHGSFLLSNNGYTWSHCFPEDNIHASLFTFKQDSTVQVILQPKFLTFQISDNPNPFKLKIEYKQDEWPQVCFCANLCSEGDSIEIVDY